MDKISCKLCTEIFKDETLFHKHLRTHKVLQAVYYQTYYPRNDKFDGKMILFKNREFYLNSDFNSRENMVSWIKSVPEAEAKAYIVEWFKKRIEKKGLVYAPAQVELRSLCIPAIFYLIKLFGDYNKLCEELGLKIKYKTHTWNPSYKSFKASHKIIRDTREQLPLKFSIGRIDEGMDFADYKLNDDKFTHNCYIERKSLSDFYGTLSSGIERFKKELERAAEAKANVIVLVESPFESVYEFINQPQVYRKVTISPEYVFHNMRNIVQANPTVQFLFVKDREEASHIIENLFKSDGYFKDIDLQYAYDTKQLIV